MRKSARSTELKNAQRHLGIDPKQQTTFHYFKDKEIFLEFQKKIELIIFSGTL